MALKQQTQIQQKQKLTPQQLQVVKLIECSALELEDKIRHELEENPALEEGGESFPSDLSNASEGEYEGDAYADTEVGVSSEEEVETGLDADTTAAFSMEDDARREYDADDYAEFDLDAYMEHDEVPDYRLQINNYSDEDKTPGFQYAAQRGLLEQLSDQTQLLTLSPREKQLTQYLIGNLDEDGYLRRDIAQIAEDIRLHTGEEVSETELYEALAQLQSLDPAGVGARSLDECLLLQLQRKPFTPAIDHAMRILEEGFEAFSLKHYDRLQQKLALSETELKEAIEEILRLNPKPGNAVSSDGTDIEAAGITPDFIFDMQSQQLVLNNNYIPPLRVSPQYRELFEDYTGNAANRTAAMREAVAFTKQKLDSAQAFIDAVRQRESTLTAVMQAIVKLQPAYFSSGEESVLKPMTMKEVAEVAGCDVSTVSRVASNKYIQMDSGIYPLKHFFTEGMLTDTGEEVSTREIKRLLQTLIDAEDKQKPLPDEQLCALLQQQGYPLARRTVAKYREQLGLPVARLRRQL